MKRPKGITGTVESSQGAQQTSATGIVALTIYTRMADPTKFTGTLRELGDLADAMWKRGEIKAKSRNKAIDILVHNCVAEDGKLLNAADVVRSLNVRKKDKGY